MQIHPDTPLAFPAVRVFDMRECAAAGDRRFHNQLLHRFTGPRSLASAHVRVVVCSQYLITQSNHNLVRKHGHVKRAVNDGARPGLKPQLTFTQLR